MQTGNTVPAHEIESSHEKNRIASGSLVKNVEHGSNRKD